MTNSSRRDFLKTSAATAALALSSRAATAMLAPLQRSTISSSGTSVCRVGLGTWRTFDVGDDAARRARLGEVLTAFSAAGGDVIDTSPMYGSSPAVLGDLLQAGGLRDRIFLATKVWTSGQAAGEAQMQEQLRLLRTDRVDLMQIHNLVDWRTQLATLRRWKDDGRARHIGITHYAPGAAAQLEEVVRAEKIDFVQYALSLEEPAATDRLLKVCADRGVAFLGNRPFAEGDAFDRVKGRELPEWAAELRIQTWGQFLLKWILAHPEVTCTIPATSNPSRVRENLESAAGAPLDPAQRDKLLNYWRQL